MFYLSITLLILILVLAIYSFVFWGTHLEMSKNHRKECESYGYAGHKKFKEQFDKVDWMIPNGWSGDFIYDLNFPSHKSSIGADLYVFNKSQMVINNPISFFIVNRYIKKRIKQIRGVNKPVKVKW